MGGRFRPSVLRTVSLARTSRPVAGGDRCGRVAPLAYQRTATPLGALRPPAAGGAFEVAVEDLFLPSSRAVETPGQGGHALQLLRAAASEKVGVRCPCAPYRAFRHPLSVRQGGGPVLFQYLTEYLAGLTFLHGREVPNGVLPLVGYRKYTVLNITRCRVCRLRTVFVIRATCGAEMVLLGPPSGEMQLETAGRVGDASRRGEEASPEVLGGRHGLAQTNARCPAG